MVEKLNTLVSDTEQIIKEQEEAIDKLRCLEGWEEWMVHWIFYDIEKGVYSAEEAIDSLILRLGFID